MTNKNNSKNKKHFFSKGILTGLVAGAAAVAVFLYGTKEGRRERKKLKGWMLMMKGEVIRKIEDTKEVNQERYNKTVDDVSNKFKKLKGISSEEVSALGDFLKSRWEHIKKEAQSGESKKK